IHSSRKGSRCRQVVAYRQGREARGTTGCDRCWKCRIPTWLRGECCGAMRRRMSMNATGVLRFLKRVAFGRDYFAREAIRRRLNARDSITEAELLRQLQERVGCSEDFAADFLDLLADESLE